MWEDELTDEEETTYERLCRTASELTDEMETTYERLCRTVSVHESVDAMREMGTRESPCVVLHRRSLAHNPNSSHAPEPMSEDELTEEEEARMQLLRERIDRANDARIHGAFLTAAEAMDIAELSGLNTRRTICTVQNTGITPCIRFMDEHNVAWWLCAALAVTVFVLVN